MQYRSLGKSRIKVSVIGFGAWGIGGDLYGPADDAESLSALNKAFDEGVNFFDTADLYGDGHSESLIGAAFAGRRDEVVVATKFGSLAHFGNYDFSPAYITSAVEDSLGRLRTDYIDLYQLHSPPLAVIEDSPGTFDALSRLKEAGKIRAIGISARSPEDGLAAAGLFPFDAIQVNFNLADQRAREVGFLEECARRDIGVIVRTPLCFGFLTGTLQETTAFDADDHRRTWSAEQRRLWAEAPGRFEKMWAARDQTPTQFALSFCLSHAGVSTVIPGMMKVSEVEENLQGAEAGLSDEELQRIYDIYGEYVWFKGKSDRIREARANEEVEMSNR